MCTGTNLKACKGGYFVWTWFRNHRGVTTLEYLVLALLLGGIGVAIVAGVSGALADTYNSAVNNVVGITGGGY